MNAKKELAQDYYRQNFLSLLTQAADLYGDLLFEPEISYMEDFQALSIPAQCLYVRLISRKGPLFRSDKLDYQEIPSISDAALELHASEYITIDAAHAPLDVLSLLMKSELLILVNDLNQPLLRGEKKVDIIVKLADEFPDLPLTEFVAGIFHIYEPIKLDYLLLYRLLFFGNFYQDLTEFVITDLGIVQYEQYPLDRRTRPFSDRPLVNMMLDLHVAGEELSEGLSEMTSDQLVAVVDTLPQPVDHPTVLRRHGRICTAVGRQLERLDDSSNAIKIYELTEYPPSRERQARLHYKAGNTSRALEVIDDMEHGSGNEEELDFALFFRGKLQGSSRKAAAGDVSDIHVINIPGPVEQSVEDYVLERFTGAGIAGYYTENALWCGLYGVALWDIIFNPVVGAFFNPYQRGPADLYEPDFYRRRESLIREKLTRMMEIPAARLRRRSPPERISVPTRSGQRWTGKPPARSKSSRSRARWNRRRPRASSGRVIR